MESPALCKIVLEQLRERFIVVAGERVIECAARMSAGTRRAHSRADR